MSDATIFTPTDILEQNLSHAGTTQARHDAEDLSAALTAAGYITIPRAQYEALMGAAKALGGWGIAAAGAIVLASHVVILP